MAQSHLLWVLFLGFYLILSAYSLIDKKHRLESYGFYRVSPVEDESVVWTRDGDGTTLDGKVNYMSISNFVDPRQLLVTIPSGRKTITKAAFYLVGVFGGFSEANYFFYNNQGVQRELFFYEAKTRNAYLIYNYYSSDIKCLKYTGIDSVFASGNFVKCNDDDKSQHFKFTRMSELDEKTTPPTAKPDPGPEPVTLLPFTKPSILDAE